MFYVFWSRGNKSVKDGRDRKKRDAGEGRENPPQSGKVSGATSTGAKGASARVKCHVDPVLRGRFLVLSVFNSGGSESRNMSHEEFMK